MRSADADLIVTLGGASVGDHDLVRAAAEALGVSIAVESVNVRPGKPTFFGVLADGRRLLGLPGNPASAFVCAELFLKPDPGGLSPAPRPNRPSIPPGWRPTCPPTARASTGCGPSWPRADGGSRCGPYRDQDSSLVSVFAAADALLGRQAGAPAAAAGRWSRSLPLARA